MKTADIREIRACLPRERTLFHYFKDRYAFELLAWAAGRGVSIRELKSGRFRSLLQKPTLRPVLAAASDGRINADRLRAYWPDDYRIYRLTLGQWGGETRHRHPWYQVSRPGRNLVLQVNFGSEHDDQYRRLVRPRKDDPFAFEMHPIAAGTQRTMSWARMDIDLGAGEALIEEIQNDWLREAFDCATFLKRDASRRRMQFFQRFLDVSGSREDFLRYADAVLGPHKKTWAEATLFAATWFLREELGIRRIFYNSHDTGIRLKGLDPGWAPPRSLYTALPRRFCFAEVNRGPEFLEREWARRLRRERRRGACSWFLLEV